MVSSDTRNNRFAPDEKSELQLYDLLGTGIVPERLIRLGIRRMLQQKLDELFVADPQAQLERTYAFARELEALPIALSTKTANNQHYEVPTEFFEQILGPRMKYSCCSWNDATTLAAAEDEMLNLYCERAELADGQRILDLGCGWGSFSLYAAQRFRNAEIVAVSNSRTQKQFIDEKARAQGFKNVSVITADMNDLSFQREFDRVVSIEMFEHAKNYKRLLGNISKWLAPDGKLFVHIFTHMVHQYHFGDREDDWLAKYFFTGGTMPSDLLMYAFDDDLRVTKHWRVNGRHYQRTSEEWLENMNRNRVRVKEIIAQTYGAEQAKRWWAYWRIFFLACAELWGYAGGSEWIVSHYLFDKR